MKRATKLFKSFDFYRKLEDEDFKRVQTAHGALLSLTALGICIFLLISNLFAYLRVDTTHELSVDRNILDQFDIHFDINIPRMQCRFLTIQVSDRGGVQQNNIKANIHMHDLDKDGKVIGDDHHLDLNSSIEEHLKVDEGKFHVPETRKRNGTNDTSCKPCGNAGEPDECCDTCDQVLNAYYRKNKAESEALQTEQCRSSGEYMAQYVSAERGGCNIHGKASVSKIDGALMVNPSRAFVIPANNGPSAYSFLRRNFDLSHHIRRFSFGPENTKLQNPLQGQDIKQDAPGIFNYFAKVVPTTQVLVGGERTEYYQYSLTSYFKEFAFGYTKSPGINVFYDLSPIRVTLCSRRHSTSFLHLFTSLCAVLGGVFTVAGMMDGALFRVRNYRAKAKLGKAT